MRRIWFVADNIFSPLGLTTKENYNALFKGETSLNRVEHNYLDIPVWTSAFTNEQKLSYKEQCPSLLISNFERFLWLSIHNAVSTIEIDIKSHKTIFIYATSKGNIELIGNKTSPNNLNLYYSAKRVTETFQNPNKPIVMSNACISGGTALLMAKKLLEEGIYDQAVVCAADTVNEFVLSGFNSLKALSTEQCKPFDLERNGINLGEGAATVILKAFDESTSHQYKINISGGAVTNDANHISGPSRTGLELASAIQTAMLQAKVNANDIGFISAHGTATIFNDEMEAKAFSHLGLTNILTNSLKGYFGHTLGAAGVIESIVSAHSMLNNTVIHSKGFNTTGTSNPLNITRNNVSTTINHCIKTLAGFGGCNTSLILSKQ